MKNVSVFLLISAFSLLLASCTRSSGNPLRPANTPTNEPVFITKAQANRMIQSYLTSIKYPQQDLYLRAIAYNADSLRAYLKDTTIKMVRFMLAHDMDYILAGGEGKVPPPGVAGLTAVIAGVNKENKYVFHLIRQLLLDNGMPCPDNCDALGHPAGALQ
ncbi:hypothetical protein LL912_12585 [Niabella sp. CC-SYL272]|uniref:hypothetical protein n=1 Tax=Niabella agricola TaxID=2891571 RepID=UPI001F273A0D|nr:hypothetical protein [Niabella agricola]MCF3109609.1 hypothetical protein [Niabella agricola]